MHLSDVHKTDQTDLIYRVSEANTELLHGIHDDSHGCSQIAIDHRLRDRGQKVTTCWLAQTTST